MTSTLTPPPRPLSRDDALDRLRDCYAVVVAGKAVRKHVYFSLPAAQRALERAEARGAHAHLALVQLVPIEEVASDD